jgi:hypothetical protein
MHCFNAKIWFSLNNIGEVLHKKEQNRNIIKIELMNRLSLIFYITENCLNIFNIIVIYRLGLKTS